MGGGGHGEGGHGWEPCGTLPTDSSDLRSWDAGGLGPLLWGLREERAARSSPEGQCASWRPPGFPPLSPGGEGHGRKAGAVPRAEAAAGARGGCGGPELWERLAGLHEVLAGAGGGGGHPPEDLEGRRSSDNTEAPEDPKPRVHLGPGPAPAPASDPGLHARHSPALGPANGPRIEPCPHGRPGPHWALPSPVGPHHGLGLEAAGAFAPEQGQEPELHQGTVGATPAPASSLSLHLPAPSWAVPLGTSSPVPWSLFPFLLVLLTLGLAPPLAPVPVTLAPNPQGSCHDPLCPGFPPPPMAIGGGPGPRWQHPVLRRQELQERSLLKLYQSCEECSEEHLTQKQEEGELSQARHCCPQAPRPCVGPLGYLQVAWAQGAWEVAPAHSAVPTDFSDLRSGLCQLQGGRGPAEPGGLRRLCGLTPSCSDCPLGRKLGRDTVLPGPGLS
ncbi:Hypothetical predicted protein [Marmota monax]|uniref:Uncharacterized protein n=1 Tax=Marmota monax TaxID=9995 RepID=A0A5E4A0D2_MARMO|nr:Hypothetical predicted protein [Marmota monax]